VAVVGGAWLPLSRTFGPLSSASGDARLEVPDRRVWEWDFMVIVDQVRATEILDSRSRPTLAVTVALAGGVSARAGVPSGASTGSREAIELRD
jgi:hypothetical protein